MHDVFHVLVFIVDDVGVIAIAVVIARHTSDIVILKGTPIAVEVIVVLASMANLGAGVVVVLTRLSPKVYIVEIVDESGYEGGVCVRQSRRSNEYAVQQMVTTKSRTGIVY